MKQTKMVLSASLFLACISSNASATFLYSVGFPDQTPLYLMDQTSGAVALIGPTGLNGIGDLTSDTRPGHGQIYGIRIEANELIEIDRATGNGTVIALLNSPDNIVSLALDPTTGRLYGTTSVAFGSSFEVLYSIDAATGNCTLVGPINFDDVFALGFSQTGKLYGVANGSNPPELISINIASGNGSAIASMQADIFDIASRPEDGVMFFAESASHHLWTLDVSNGNPTDVGSYTAGSPNIVGLAFSEVPEPGTMGLLAMAVPTLALRHRRAVRRSTKNT